MRRRTAALLLAGLLLGPAARAAGQPANCAVPPELLEPGQPLPAVARALERGRLSVLALGSASVAGSGATGPDASWPARLEARLAALFPQARVEVAVRGGRGVTAAEHLALLREDAAPPDLVVWQAGTVEAARGLDPDELSEALRAGLERVRRWGSDAVLVDPQFSRFLRANSNIEPYRDQLRLAAAAAGAPLFRRWDVMRHWVETGALDLERTPREERPRVVDRLNACLGAALARLVADGAALARR